MGLVGIPALYHFLCESRLLCLLGADVPEGGGHLGNKGGVMRSKLVRFGMGCGHNGFTLLLKLSCLSSKLFFLCGPHRRLAIQLCF